MPQTSPSMHELSSYDSNDDGLVPVTKKQNWFERRRCWVVTVMVFVILAGVVVAIAIPVSSALQLGQCCVTFSGNNTCLNRPYSPTCSSGSGNINVAECGGSNSCGPYQYACLNLACTSTTNGLTKSACKSQCSQQGGSFTTMASSSLASSCLWSAKIPLGGPVVYPNCN